MLEIPESSTIDEILGRRETRVTEIEARMEQIKLRVLESLTAKVAALENTMDKHTDLLIAIQNSLFGSIKQKDQAYEEELLKQTAIMKEQLQQLEGISKTLEAIKLHKFLACRMAQN